MLKLDSLTVELVSQLRVPLGHLRLLLLSSTQRTLRVQTIVDAGLLIDGTGVVAG